MAATLQFSDARDELIHLAKALEGIEGAIHSGRPVAARDVEQATRATLLLRPPTGWSMRENPFHAACDDVQRLAPLLAGGDALVRNKVQAAVHEMAKTLRTEAGRVAGKPDISLEADATIQRLGAGYARYASHGSADSD